MFKIGEFSKLVRVSPRMLRHYEKCGLIYPAEIDRTTGYRQYGAGQIPLVSRIVTLRDAGFSIDEIGDLLPRFEDAAYMDKTLCEKSASVRAAIDSEEKKLMRLGALRGALGKGQVIMKYEVVLKELPKIKALTLREVIPSYDSEHQLWHKLGKYMAQNQIACPDCEEAGYSIYWDDDHKEKDVDVEIAVPVETMGENKDGVTYRELDAIPLAATLRFEGPYEQYSAVMAELGAWMEQNSYTFAGPVRGCSIRSPQDQSDPQNYLTEIQVPVRRMER